MKYKKGESGNPAGRKKGSQNRVNLIAKQAISELLESEAKHLPELLKELEPKDRIDAFCKLAKFVLPALRAQEVNAELSGVMLQKVKVPQFLVDIVE